MSRSINGKLKKEIAKLERVFAKTERRVRKLTGTLVFLSDQITVRQRTLDERVKLQKEFENE